MLMINSWVVRVQFSPIQSIQANEPVLINPSISSFVSYKSLSMSTINTLLGIASIYAVFLPLVTL